MEDGPEDDSSGSTRDIGSEQTRDGDNMSDIGDENGTDEAFDDMTEDMDDEVTLAEGPKKQKDTRLGLLVRKKAHKREVAPDERIHMDEPDTTHIIFDDGQSDVDIGLEYKPPTGGYPA